MHRSAPAANDQSQYLLLTVSLLFHNRHRQKLLLFLDFNVGNRLSCVVILSTPSQFPALLPLSLLSLLRSFAGVESSSPFLSISSALLQQNIRVASRAQIPILELAGAAYDASERPPSEGA